ncbi:hypothetical protein JOE49_002140 [Paenibacillus sp. PvR133]|nr:hypothetical protein [Paenibacillus sp. PvR133]
MSLLQVPQVELEKRLQKNLPLKVRSWYWPLVVKLVCKSCKKQFKIMAGKLFIK